MRNLRVLLLAACGLASFVGAVSMQPVQAEKVKCIVSGAEIEVTDKTPSVSVNGQKSYFCCENCPKAFKKEPEKFVKAAGMCPINKGGAAKVTKESRQVVNNNLYYFCCANCPKAFAGDPAKGGVKELIDPVSKKAFALTAESPRSTYEGQIYIFGDAAHKEAFDKEPAKFAVVYGK